MYDVAVFTPVVSELSLFDWFVCRPLAPICFLALLVIIFRIRVHWLSLFLPILISMCLFLQWVLPTYVIEGSTHWGTILESEMKLLV
jgi:hypothetical protein